MRLYSEISGVATFYRNAFAFLLLAQTVICVILKEVGFRRYILIKYFVGMKFVKIISAILQFNKNKSTIIIRRNMRIVTLPFK